MEDGNCTAPPTATTYAPAARLFMWTSLDADQPRRPWQPISCAPFQDNGSHMRVGVPVCVGVCPKPEAMVWCRVWCSGLLAGTAQCSTSVPDCARRQRARAGTQAPWLPEDPCAYAMQPFDSHALHFISFQFSSRYAAVTRGQGAPTVSAASAHAHTQPPRMTVPGPIPARGGPSLPSSGRRPRGCCTPAHVHMPRRWHACSRLGCWLNSAAVSQCCNAVRCRHAGVECWPAVAV